MVMLSKIIYWVIWLYDNDIALYKDNVTLFWVFYYEIYYKSYKPKFLIFLLFSTYPKEWNKMLGQAQELTSTSRKTMRFQLLCCILFLHELIVLLTCQYSGRTKTTKSFHVFVYSCILQYLFNFMLNTTWIFIQYLSTILPYKHLMYLWKWFILLLGHIRY